MQDSLPQEVILVRRKPAWEEERKSAGVWKIAHADFMTALMAFFLVMWLINVTDDSVRRGVAQYFNPVKLASTSPTQKGLNDPFVSGETNEGGTSIDQGTKVEFGVSGSPAVADQAGEASPTPGQGERSSDSQTAGEFNPRHSESRLFTDPYAVLDTLAKMVQTAEEGESSPEGIGSGLERQAGARGGTAYRDPFDPLYWQLMPSRDIDGKPAPDTMQETADASGETAAVDPSSISDSEGAYSLPGLGAAQNMQSERRPLLGAPDEPVTDAAREILAVLEGDPVTPAGGPGDGEASSLDDETVEIASADQAGERQPVKSEAQPLDPDAAAEAALQQGGETVAPGEGIGSGGPLQEPGSELVSELQAQLSAVSGTELQATADRIEITQTEDGAALISLTDGQDFGMFAIGSAEPRPELVALLQRLGGVIAEKPGDIILKGHTDARPFRSDTYDNWRLSSARAHMALYMLTRGGVDAGRFVRVEGYADRELKDADDPFSAVNRRVEILLKEPRG